MRAVSFRRLDLAEVDWTELDAFADRTVYQTRPWLEFLVRTQKADPVLAAVSSGRRHLGYFTGGVVRRYGVRILGSPFPGWTTAYMGFNLRSDADRPDVMAALPAFAFGELRCAHLELMDRRVTLETARSLGFEHRRYQTYEIDLRRTEAALFAAMTSACRRNIRKAERNGVTVEEAHDPDFADDYHAQLRDVFAKQGLVPTYGVDRVRALIDCVHPAGRVLLLLRARNAAGRGIATGVFPAFNDTMFFWGGASWRPDQIERPNEVIQWYAMRYWKARGISRYDMGGAGAYKEKYGPATMTVPWLRRSRYEFIAPLRDTAKKTVRTVQRVRGLVQGRR